MVLLCTYICRSANFLSPLVHSISNVCKESSSLVLHKNFRVLLCRQREYAQIKSKHYWRKFLKSLENCAYSSIILHITRITYLIYIQFLGISVYKTVCILLRRLRTSFQRVPSVDEILFTCGTTFFREKLSERRHWNVKMNFFKKEKIKRSKNAPRRLACVILKENIFLKNTEKLHNNDFIWVWCVCLLFSIWQFHL